MPNVTPRARSHFRRGGREVVADRRRRAFGLASDARDDGGQIAIVDGLFAIRVRDDGAVDLIELGTVERHAELLAAPLNRVAARVLAEHERRLRHADIFGPHDLVGPAILQHAVLMNASLVRECVAADDRFVGLDALAGQGGQQLRRRENLPRVHCRVGTAGCRPAHAWP